MKFFGSDEHYHHANIIKFCNRPFATPDDMNEALIANHNAVVGVDDDFFCLGDFSFAKHQADIEGILSRLNGRKHLILGNHDHKQTRKAKGWHTIFSDNIVEMKIDPIPAPFVLCHYPILSWNRRFHGAIHLFGHIHSDGKTPAVKNAVDVGVDAWNYKPVSVQDILDYVKEN